VDEERLIESYKARQGGSWTFSVLLRKMRFSILTTAAFATLISTVFAVPNPEPQGTICPIGLPIPEYC
jgi:hypothetical protein